MPRLGLAEYSPKTASLQEMLQEIFAEHPALSNAMDPDKTRAIRSTQPSNGRLLEFYPPGESENPSPGNTTLELFGQNDPDTEKSLMYADLLHGMKNDPRYAKMRRQFGNNLSPQAEAMERREGRSVPLGDNMLDAYIRGGLSPETNPEWQRPGIYSPTQKNLLGKMALYLSPRNHGGILE